jgi:hypothetical protein
MERRDLEAWIELYERAWRTPGTQLLADLFAPDATYSTAPFTDRHRGLAAIEQLWEAERTGPDERFTLTSEILAVEADTGVARIEVVYEDLSPHDGRHYLDLWIVRLDEQGRCTSFEEWFWLNPEG